jgi:hypothetical protein
MQKEVIIIDVKTEAGRAELKKLKGEVQGVNKQVGATSKGFTGVFSAITGGVTQAIPALNGLKTALLSTGIGAIVIAVGSFVALLGKAVNKSTDFAKAMSGVKAVIGDVSDNEFSALIQSAKDFGSSTAFTAVQVAELQTELAKLGFTTQEILNAQGATLDLAASLDVSLADAATLAGSTLRSFGLDTSETQRVVDVLAKSTSKSALDFSSLTESLKLVAPTARALGIDIEQTAAMLGVLANNGLKGSVAGTGLAKAFIALNQKGVSLEKALSKVASSSNQLNTAIELVGIVGAKALLTLSTGGADVDVLTEALLGAEGAAKLLAETRLDNLAGDTTKLASAWEGFLLNIESGDGALTKLARGTIQLLTNSLDFLQKSFALTAFTFQDNWRSIGEYTSAGVQIVGSYFKGLGEQINLFSNKAKLAISDIPLLGDGLDRKTIEKNISESKKLIENYAIAVGAGFQRITKENLMRQSSSGRFALQQQKEIDNLSLKQTQAKLLDDLEIEEKATDEQKEIERKRAEEVQKIREKLFKEQRDLDAKTEEEKLQLGRTRALLELDNIKLNVTERRELELQINNLYDQKEAELAIVQSDKATELAEKQAAEQKKIDEKALADKLLIDEAKIQSQFQLVALYSEAMRAISFIFERGTAASKAAAISEVAINAGLGFANALTIAQKSASATGPAAAFAFPIFYASQIASVLGAVGQAKNILSTVKGGSNLPFINGPRGGSTQTASNISAPSFNIVGQSGTNQLAESIGSQEKKPLKAYVVSGDVTTAQAMERNIIASASI